MRWVAGKLGFEEWWIASLKAKGRGEAWVHYAIFMSRQDAGEWLNWHRIDGDVVKLTPTWRRVRP